MEQLLWQPEGRNSQTNVGYYRRTYGDVSVHWRAGVAVTQYGDQWVMETGSKYQDAVPLAAQTLDEAKAVATVLWRMRNA